MPSTAQERVAAFLAAHDLETDPEYRVLDSSRRLGRWPRRCIRTVVAVSRFDRP